MKKAIKVICYIQGVLSGIHIISGLFFSTILVSLIYSNIGESSLDGSHTEQLLHILAIGFYALVALICCFDVFLCFFVPTRIDKATKKNDVIVWGILSIFFINVIVGILILALSDDDFQKPVPEIKDVVN